MTHLVLDEVTSYRRGHIIPPHVRWFINGYLGIRFLVNEDGLVYPYYGLGGKLGWRNQTKVNMAEQIAEQINSLLNGDYANINGIGFTVEDWLIIGYVKWVEDQPTDYVDLQPEDYIDPHPMTKFGCDHDVT